MNDSNLNQQNQNDNSIPNGSNTQPQMNPMNQPVNPAPQMNPMNQPVNPAPQMNPMNQPVNPAPQMNPMNQPVNPTPQMNPMNQPVNPAPQMSVSPASQNKNNKKNKGIIFAIIGIIIVILAIVLAFSLNNNEQEDGDKTGNKETKESGIKNSSLMANTKWIASDGSEVIFTSNKISWYQEEGVYTDNYYEGKYKFYIGKDAVEYITTDLKEYGITKSELERIFSSGTEYAESNFVVFDIRYDKFILDGEKMEISRPLVPWYGFILEDNTFLDVANMNTASYYEFTKK